MAFGRDNFATDRCGKAKSGAQKVQQKQGPLYFAWGCFTSFVSTQKVDPPGGTTGRVGCGTGWMRRPCRTQDPREAFFSSKSVRCACRVAERKRFSNRNQLQVDLSNCRCARGPCSCRRRRTG